MNLDLVIPCISEVVGTFLWCVCSQERAYRCADSILCPGGGFSKQVFELGKNLLDGVQIGRVFWQQQEFGTRLADCPTDGMSLMAAEVVHDDDVVRQQGGNQDLLDIDPKPLTVDRAIEKPGRFDAVVTQGSHEGHGIPMSERSLGHQPFALRRPASQRRHVGLGPGLVNENQTGGINLPLIALPLRTSARDVGSGLLAGVQCFF